MPFPLGILRSRRSGRLSINIPLSLKWNNLSFFYFIWVSMYCTMIHLCSLLLETPLCLSSPWTLVGGTRHGYKLMSFLCPLLLSNNFFFCLSFLGLFSGLCLLILILDDLVDFVSNAKMRHCIIITNQHYPNVFLPLSIDFFQVQFRNFMFGYLHLHPHGVDI